MRQGPRQLPAPEQFPGAYPDGQMQRRPVQPERPPKARLFAPRGKI
jgi:hypothetical protein